MAKMKASRIKLYRALIVASYLALASSTALAQTNSTSQRRSRQKAGNNGLITEQCGTSDQLANQVEICSKPLMDIIEGTMAKWPQNNQEVEELCEKFAVSERCVRDRGRKCGKGLEKVITSTLANSVQRTRKKECQKAKLGEVAKLTKCIESHTEIPWAIIANATNRLSVIEKMQDLDRKTTAVCCTITDIEREMTRLFKPVCATEGALMVRMYRSVLQDVRDIICLSPKCQPNPFRGYTIPRNNVSTTDGIVSYMLRIIFSLGS